MQVCKPCHYAKVEAVEPFKLHTTSMWYMYERFEHLLRLWMGNGFTLTSIPQQTLPQIWRGWHLMQVCKSCHYTLVEAVEPFKLHPMSMSYMYEVFEHLLRLWMGIWLHNHTITTTDASPDLGRFAEILPNARVQTMPLCFGWGCRTFQTASPIYVIHSLGVWVPSQIVDGHMASHSHLYHHRCFPRFVWVG